MSPFGFVDHDRDQQARVLRRREADERGDELGLRVGAVDDLLRGAGLAGERVAGDADLGGGAARRRARPRASRAAAPRSRALITRLPGRLGVGLLAVLLEISRGVRRMPPLAIAE